MNDTDKSELCEGAWSIPPTPLMISKGNNYHTCSICGKKADAPRENDQSTRNRVDKNTDKSQEELLAFVTDPKTIAAAVEGSMEKRQAEFDKSELDKMLDFLEGRAQLDGKWFGDAVPGTEHAYWWRKDLRRLITQQCNQARLEGRIEAGKHFRGYMISTSPFVDEILNPYLTEHRQLLKAQAKETEGA